MNFANSVPKGDALLFTDAFDVMFMNDPEYILQTFLQFEGSPRILFAGECGCWPHVMEDPDACFNKYPEAPTPYRYLNSGTWIGFAGEAHQMLAEVMRLAGSNFVNANDQKLCADMYISGEFGIKLDFHARLFQSVHMTLDPPLKHCNPVQDLSITESGHWHNSLTGTRPAVFHFNGGGKVVHLRMEGQMWYRQQQKQKRSQIHLPSSMPRLQEDEFHNAKWLGEQRIHVPTQPGFDYLNVFTLCALILHYHN